ncbi:cytochrome-b5 reductase [Capronia epimyces CBS 606.96]|uniref:Cytochrome-b5 reductase n=1 Tax=Capronia epimyces CBS 606.96 TaxID=1182542 RepID=W9Y2Z5_9EURO|nr:cytochrome-b5 reductase [Capronia epimyces CBS 606.96]EXJ87192.1 cytochrome-b5 reductase [Capronia epimyces CBS 606.96]
MSRKLTYADVEAHTGRHDLWVIIHGKVLDLSKFVDEHPGGEEVLVDQGGKDASDAFEDVGHSPEARQLLETLVIGSLDKKV